MKQTEKRLYEVPAILVIEVSQASVICASAVHNNYSDDNYPGDTHWTVDHETEDITRDDDWEEEQDQDWGDSWGEY